MFDLFADWHDPPGFTGVFLRDQPVQVNTNAVWPYGTDRRSTSLAPLDVREHGLHIDTLARGRLIAWVRCAPGNWLAVVEVRAGSRSGSSAVTMTLWVPPNAVKPL